jgi:nucleoid-associated protein YgaU
MSVRRLLSTAATMAALAWALALLTPSFADMTGAVLGTQRTADSAGAEALVLAGAGLAAWGVWAWGALGLVLTAGSAVPGLLGQAAGTLTHVVLPRGARRGAALALGIGLGVVGPLAGTALVVVTAPAAAAETTSTPVPDWPGALPEAGALPDGPGGPDAVPPTVPALPDWPSPPVAGDHVVLRGDCLWDIAAAHLSDRLGRTPSDAETARATSAWWAANAAVIGADPDVLLPGQVLRPPPA